MPEGHRRFLADLEGAYPGGLRKVVGELVMASDSSPALVPLKEAFDTAVAALGAFRNRHLQMVTRYIIIPSRQPGGVQGQGVNLATASSARAGGGGAREELTGTGGTALLPFLKQSRDETFRARRLQGVSAG
jgi:indoleamine 2,3-dioxygenase